MGSLCRFFSSKEGIFEQLVRDVFEITMQMSRQATVGEDCPWVTIGYELAMSMRVALRYAVRSTSGSSSVEVRLVEYSTVQARIIGLGVPGIHTDRKY
ncbi:hypothetical protein D9M70_278980 [compost metagenome]